jgi:hypothetical protein
MSAACACKNSLNLEVITPSITGYLKLLPKIDLQPSSMPLFSRKDWDNSTKCIFDDIPNPRRDAIYCQVHGYIWI